MTRTARRTTVALVAAAAAVALAAPASADNVDVALGALGGTRQFAVEDVSGAPLTAINLGTGGVQPFRTHITDAGFTNVTKGYTVGATMSNLYLKSGSTYDYSTSVPSSAVSLVYPTNPLAALGVTFPVLPPLSLSGLLPSCLSMDSATKTVLGLDASGLTSNLSVTALCTALGSAGVTVGAGTQQVTGLTRTVTAAASNLADIPTQLTGATSGAFTNADYSDASKGFTTAPGASGAPTPTSLRIMTGTPNMTSALQSEIASKVNTAIASLPLTATTGDSQMTIAAALSALSSSTDAGVALVGSDLSLLTAAQQSAVINLLSSALGTLGLPNIPSLNGQYYGLPSLKSVPTGLTAGTYDGTLTVTFVQQ